MKLEDNPALSQALRHIFLPCFGAANLQVEAECLSEDSYRITTFAYREKHCVNILRKGRFWIGVDGYVASTAWGALVHFVGKLMVKQLWVPKDDHHVFGTVAAEKRRRERR